MKHHPPPLHQLSRQGSAMVFGLVMVMMVSGLVAGYLMTSVTRSRNVADAARHQQALYAAQAGIAKARWMMAVEDSAVPEEIGETHSFSGASGSGHYYVTLTRKADSDGLMGNQDSGMPEITAGDWSLVDGQIVSNQPLQATITVLGAEIQYNGLYDMMTTMGYFIGDIWHDPHDFDLAVTGNLNDNEIHTFTTVVPVGSGLYVSGRSWIWHDNDNTVQPESFWLDTQDDDWYIHLTKNSVQNSAHVLALRDGDATPAYNPLFGQDAISDLIADYVDAEGIIHLEPHQAIYLFELGQVSASESSSDFQDLVVLVSLAAEGSTQVGSDDKGSESLEDSSGESSWVISPLEGLYEVVSTGIVGNAIESLTAVVDLRAGVWEDLIPQDSVILTQENLTLSGVTLTGPHGAAHTNATGIVEGLVDVSVALTSSAMLNISGTLSVEGSVVDAVSYAQEHELLSPVLIPLAEPHVHEDHADYILVSSGLHEGMILDRANEQYVEAETLGWRYGAAVGGENPGDGETVTVYDNTSAMGQFFGGILAEGSLSLAGSVDGSVPHVHANGPVTISGGANMSIAGDLTSAASITVNGNPAVAGEMLSDIDPLPVPVYTAADFEAHAGYELISTGSHAGKIRDLSDDTLIQLPSSMGWRFHQGKWELKWGAQFHPGFYIAQGDVKLHANGTLQLTLVTTGKISIGPNMALHPYAEGLGILTDGDIEMASNSSSSGIFYAGGKVDLTGTGSINGQVIARGNGSSLSGNFTVAGNGTLSLPSNDAEGASFTVINPPSEEHGEMTGVWELYDPLTAASGLYYGDCRVIISAPLGQASDPFPLTLALTGNLNITGNAALQPAAAGLLFEIGGDLTTSEDPTLHLTGILLIGEQFNITGALDLTGLLLAAGQSQLSAVASENFLVGQHHCQRGLNLQLPLDSEAPALGTLLYQLRKSTLAERQANLSAF